MWRQPAGKGNSVLCVWGVGKVKKSSLLFQLQEAGRKQDIQSAFVWMACLKTSNQWPKKTKCSSCSPLCFLLNSTHSGHFMIQKVLWTLCHFCLMETTPPIMGCSAAFEWMKAQWICITSVHSETRNLSVWWRILWSYEDIHVPAWQQLFSLFYRLFNIMAQFVFSKSSEMHSIQFYSILWLNTHCSSIFFLDILIIFEIIFYSIPFRSIVFYSVA